MTRPMEMLDMFQFNQIRECFLADARRYLFAAEESPDLSPGSGRPGTPLSFSIDASISLGKTEA